MTTSSPQLARDISEVAELSGRHAFDAPVTGGPQGAQDATLTVFCGTDEDTLSGVRDVLECMAARVIAFGSAGKGQMAKLANQTALAGAMVGFAEAVALAKQGGLDVAQTLDALKGGMGDSKAMATFGPKVLAGDYRPGFMVDHYLKDLNLIAEAAEGMELTLPGIDTARDLYGVLASIGAGRLGTQTIALMYEDEQTCAQHGLDWSLLDAPEHSEGDGEGHTHGEACSCGHDHAAGHVAADDDDDEDYEEYDVAASYGLESFYDPMRAQ
jgi:3-hydroxyisobutyrate dehydrogenase